MRNCNADTLMPEYKLIVFVVSKECSTCAVKSMSECKRIGLKKQE